MHINTPYNPRLIVDIMLVVAPLVVTNENLYAITDIKCPVSESENSLDDQVHVLIQLSQNRIDCFYSRVMPL